MAKARPVSIQTEDAYDIPFCFTQNVRALNHMAILSDDVCVVSKRSRFAVYCGPRKGLIEAPFKIYIEKSG